MRHPRGALLPPIRAERVRGRDLCRTLRNAILESALGSGQRLPSSRQVAADYGVSRGLVEVVYGQLVQEGFLDRGIGRGTFVAAQTAKLDMSRNTKPSRRTAALSRRGSEAVERAVCREPEVLRPFNAGTADTREFPWRIWQRLQSAAARGLGRNALEFADPRGLPALRTSIARHLTHFRGMLCRPEQVVVFNSSQQALLALMLLLLDRGDEAWIEDPCYAGARAACDLAGAVMRPVPVDEHGLCVEIGARASARARLVYVTPSHQYPTGAMMSFERRIALLEWAARSEAWIVEDDYDSEFRYRGQPLTPLWQLDIMQRVLYLGTLSKAMFVALRLAYVVVPERLTEPLANLRTQIDGFTPALAQATMSAFMEEGHFPTHLRRMRGIYGAKHAALVSGLAPLAARGWTWSSEPAGLHVLVRHRSRRHVRAVADASGLELAFLDACRSRPAGDDGLLLRFGGLELDSVQRGVDALVAAERQTRGPRRPISAR